MIYHLISGAFTFVAIGIPVISYVSKKKDSLHVQPLKLQITQKIPALLLVIGLIMLSFTGTAMKIPQRTEVWVEKSNQTSVRIEIQADSWAVTDNLVAYEGETAFSLLKRCAEKNSFSIESTYYDEFDSTMINSINNVVSGTEGKYWQYYVNDMLPNVGADKYIVTNGDMVQWSFEIL